MDYSLLFIKVDKSKGPPLKRMPALVMMKANSMDKGNQMVLREVSM